MLRTDKAVRAERIAATALSGFAKAASDLEAAATLQAEIATEAHAEAGRLREVAVAAQKASIQNDAVAGNLRKLIEA